MIDGIIYNSKTGHVKAYAYKLAKMLSLPCFNIKEANKKLPKGSNVVFISWIRENKLVKFDRCNKYNLVFSVGVGINPVNLAYIDFIKSETKIYGDFFYLRGGISKSGVGFFDYFVLRSIREELEFKALNKQASSVELELLDIIINKRNLINFEDLNKIVEYVNKRYLLVDNYS